ncbi:hypothetical protein [Agaribacter flavus]|uniref:PEGA domain-containing protein n=1 Tax=Agaribacter flavus TaxID=1902781 RepID=A0ABV7FRD8_9ALTE
MDNKKLSADQQIAARQRALQTKLKRGVWGGLALIAVMLLAYVIWQHLTDKNIEFVEVEEVSESQQKSVSTEEWREQVMQKLAAFDAELSTEIDQAGFADWAGTRLSETLGIKNQALSSFAASDFLQALKLAEQFEKEIRALLEEWQNDYQESIANAWRYLDEGKIQQAQLSYNQAKNIAPADPDGETLDIKLSSFAEVKELQQSLQIAEVENNYAKQRDFLRQILALDPSLSSENEKLQKVEEILKKRRLSEVLQQADKAISNKQISRADKLLQEARRIDSKALGITSLDTKLSALKREQDLLSRITALEKLAETQDWSAVAKRAQANLNVHPNTRVFEETLAKATYILEHQQKIKALTANTDRLEDEGIREIAINRLKEALPFSIYSAPLANEIGKLSAALEQYQSEVEVNIQSDGQSYILVLGVGHVGKVEQKNIRLTPGTYTFEAKREGFKTERISVQVKRNATNIVRIANTSEI